MKNVTRLIFGAACMVSGLLLVLIMLFAGHFQDAYDGLTFLGKCVVWGGVSLAVFGTGYCLWNQEP